MYEPTAHFHKYYLECEVFPLRQEKRSKDKWILRWLSATSVQNAKITLREVMDGPSKDGSSAGADVQERNFVSTDVCESLPSAHRDSGCILGWFFLASCAQINWQRKRTQCFGGKTGNILSDTGCKQSKHRCHIYGSKKSTYCKSKKGSYHSFACLATWQSKSCWLADSGSNSWLNPSSYCLASRSLMIRHHFLCGDDYGSEEDIGIKAGMIWRSLWFGRSSLVGLNLAEQTWCCQVLLLNARVFLSMRMLLMHK